MDTGIKTDVRIRCNRPDIYILDKRKNKQTLVEDRITFQDSLQTVETGKIRNYDLLANELGRIYKFMTCDGIVAKYHKIYLKRLQISMNIKAYMQSIPEESVIKCYLGTEMHKQPEHSLKKVDNKEDGGIDENINEESDLEENYGG
ncbi:hypothetical protein CWI38_2155p0020 [Hamiltosporidium tvaerminnensis]|uniref:Uncharacterized protein n=1 Tax=Hamiltosporidium tvaerminnensis TaxID=1176355 RepID=A0A4Q9LPD4_9MICR|nr:hypothetical protein CWI38_2155p0020 [Hamiltosporidium tvaerminnensis]